MNGRPLIGGLPNLFPEDFDDRAMTQRGSSIGSSVGTLLGTGLGLAFPPAMALLPFFSSAGSAIGTFAGMAADRKRALRDYGIYDEYRNFVNRYNDATKKYYTPETAYVPDFMPNRYAALRLGSGIMGPTGLALAARNYKGIDNANKVLSGLAFSSSMLTSPFSRGLRFPFSKNVAPNLPDLSPDTMESIKKTFFP